MALASLAHVFVQRAFSDKYRRARSALQIAPQLSAYALEAVADDLKDSLAWQAIEFAKQSWRARMPERPTEWFDWLTALPQAELIEFLALCTALSLNALPNAGSAADANALAKAVALDMADWWEPTAQGYLNHVPKAQILQALKEAEVDSANLGGDEMKKDLLVANAASLLAGKRWLPAELRSTPA